MGCGYVVCALLVLGGLALIAGVRSKDAPHRRTETWLGLTFGVMLCAGGVALIGPMQREVARAKDRVRREQERPGAPWTWDPAWTNPRGIVQARRRHGGIQLAFGLLALAMTLPIAIAALPKEVAKGNFGALALLIFPLVGGGMVAMAAVDGWRRRKYGVAHFVPATLPVSMGAELAGMVIIDRAVVPTGPGRVELVCWCSTLTRTHNKTRRRDEAVSHTEREIAAEDWKSSGRETQLFVQLPVRGGSATTMHKLDRDCPCYEWRLRLMVPTAGADFVAEFTLPVFVTAEPLRPEGASSEAFGRGATLTRGERAAVWRAAGIVEEPQPGAVGETALVLPQANARALVWAPLLMAAVPLGIAAAVWVGGGPKFISVVLALFAVLPALAVPALWSGGGERIWVQEGAVCVQRGGTPERRLSAGSFERIDARKSVGVGTRQFYRVQARQRPVRERRIGKLFRIATMVRGDEAANEVVAWLEERLTRPGV